MLFPDHSNLWKLNICQYSIEEVLAMTTILLLLHEHFYSSMYSNQQYQYFSLNLTGKCQSYFPLECISKFVPQKQSFGQLQINSVDQISDFITRFNLIYLITIELVHKANSQ